VTKLSNSASPHRETRYENYFYQHGSAP